MAEKTDNIMYLMVVYISKKQSLARLLLSSAAAILAALVMNRLFAGPRLGPHYDYLMGYKPPPPVSRELLLIDTGGGGTAPGSEDHILEPQAAIAVLMTLTEMDAAALIIQTPILGISGGGPDTEDMIFRLNEEYTLLDRNIRNLFDALRVGSIAPEDADRYVGDLVSLAERGKDRLVSALIRHDETALVQFEEALAVFGNAHIPGDLRFQLIRPGETPEERPVSPWYSKPRPDPDGKLRRIAPLLSAAEGNAEHVVYAALKGGVLAKPAGRYQSLGIEYTESGPALFYQEEEQDIRVIPLDIRGAILIDAPRGGEFRNIALSDFLRYEELDRDLRRSLGEAETLGLYRDLAPEAYPSALYDYALSLKETLSGRKGEKAAWIEARNRYFRALEVFFQGSPGINPQAGNAAEEPEDVSGTLAALRKGYASLTALRKRLEGTLPSSFCVLGAASRDGEPLEAEASLFFANSILTGHVIIPGSTRYILFWSLAAAFFIALCICRMGPGASLGIGLGMILLEGGIFSYSFILSSYWIDPLIPIAAAGVGLGTSLFCALTMKRGAARRLQRAYGPHVSPDYLKALIRGGGPLPQEIRKAKTAIVAVSNPALTAGLDPLKSAKAAAEFRNAVLGVFTKAGAVLVGYEGDLVLIAFGSPLERSALETMGISYGDDGSTGEGRSPASKAVGFVSGLLEDGPERVPWRFGIDTGECAFSYSAAAGYGAFGQAAVRSRILAGLSPRYNAQVLVTRAVTEKIDTMPFRRLGSLVDQNNQEKEPFYQLLGNPANPFR
jgi:class 3 adenylate cyclase